MSENTCICPADGDESPYCRYHSVTVRSGTNQPTENIYRLAEEALERGGVEAYFIGAIDDTIDYARVLADHLQAHPEQWDAGEDHSWIYNGPRISLGEDMMNTYRPSATNDRSVDKQPSALILRDPEEPKDMYIEYYECDGTFTLACIVRNDSGREVSEMFTLTPDTARLLTAYLEAHHVPR